LRVDPIIFIPNESKNPLNEVLVEKYDDFDIFWYHWPKDGEDWFHFIFREEDYEPVIVVYCNDKVVCTITRAHWEYQHNDIKEMELVTPCQVLFEDQWHNTNIQRKVMEDPFDVAQAAFEHYCGKNV